ncbi:IS4 family transposase [Sunxiuqinia dokdonensis]|nr:IS4 family transposase [Sunxiuqinia dokdonensis]
MASSLKKLFSSEELMDTAIKAGFKKRKSKLNPFVFFDLMMYESSFSKLKSLNQLAVEAQSSHDIGISKQGIDKRFNNQAVNFLKLLIEKQLSGQLTSQLDSGWLNFFNRVVIKDSTRFELPEQYSEHLPGSGGAASKAGACVQFEFDLKSGQIIDLSLTAANRPDVRDSLEALEMVQSNDLIIRDLGYFAFKSFLNIEKKKAFFISRLRPKTIVYELKAGELRQMDFGALYRRMKKYGLTRIEKDVCIGNEPKIPVRLIIDLLPDEVYQQRILKSNKTHKRKGYTSSEKFKLMSRFNLIITNVPEDILPISAIPLIYKIRWQIELVFKIWKSVLGVHHIRNMKYTRWLCHLYFKLLLMIVNWNIIMSKRPLMYEKTGKLLSLFKCFKTLFDNTYRLRNVLRHGLQELSHFWGWIDQLLYRNHWLEKKKNKLSSEEIMHSMY